MGIDFPAFPLTGNQFTSGDLAWEWDGTKWIRVPGPPGGGTSGNFLPLSGGTLSGPLIVNADVTMNGGELRIHRTDYWAGIGLFSDNTTFGNFIRGNRNGLARWVILIGDDTAEPGISNIGTNFAIQRCDDAGNVIDETHVIDRSTGETTFTYTINVTTGGALLDNAGDLVLNTPSSGSAGSLYWNLNNKPQWQFKLVNAGTGGNTGDDIQLIPWSDGSTPLPAALQFTRSTGLGTVAGPPTDPLGIATKGYVDQKTAGGAFSDAPADSFDYGRLNNTWNRVLPLTGGTLSGPLIVQSNVTVTGSNGVSIPNGGIHLLAGAVGTDPTNVNPFVDLLPSDLYGLSVTGGQLNLVAGQSTGGAIVAVYTGPTRVATIGNTGITSVGNISSAGTVSAANALSVGTSPSFNLSVSGGNQGNINWASGYSDYFVIPSGVRGWFGNGSTRLALDMNTGQLHIVGNGISYDSFSNNTFAFNWQNPGPTLFCVVAGAAQMVPISDYSAGSWYGVNTVNVDTGGRCWVTTTGTGTVHSFYWATTQGSRSAISKQRAADVDALSILEKLGLVAGERDGHHWDAILLPSEELRALIPAAVDDPPERFADAGLLLDERPILALLVRAVQQLHQELKGGGHSPKHHGHH